MTCEGGDPSVIKKRTGRIPDFVEPEAEFNWRKYMPLVASIVILIFFTISMFIGIFLVRDTCFIILVGIGTGVGLLTLVIVLIRLPKERRISYRKGILIVDDLEIPGPEVKVEYDAKRKHIILHYHDGKKKLHELGNDTKEFFHCFPEYKRERKWYEAPDR